MKINNQDIDVDLKIKAIENCGINDIHENIKFKDGHFDISLQIGHPQQADSVKGCFSTHLIQMCLVLQQHYQDMLPCMENENAIVHLQCALEELNNRANRRKQQNILNTDKESS